MGLLSLALLISACGGEGSSGGERPAATPTSTAITREDVIAALGVTPGRDENGVPNSDRRAGCYAFKIFARPEDNMQAYIQIGDPVATNPSQTVGAVVGTYRGVSVRRCQRLFERRLAKLG